MISRISGQIDRKISSASAGAMNSAASQRSLSHLNRAAAGGSTSFCAGGASGEDFWSVWAMVQVAVGGARWRPGGCLALAPGLLGLAGLVAALVEDGLLLRGELVQRGVRLLGARQRGVDLGGVDVHELRVLRQVPEVLQTRNRLG